jgi:peroxiredoxin
VTIEEATRSLALGAPCPDFNLPGTDGRHYGRASFEEASCLVVVFLANHCPYVGAWEDRLIAIPKEFADRGVRFAAVSSSDPMRFPKDSLEEMRRRAEDRGYPFPYLFDETQAVAGRFGATRTPEAFVFDSQRRLRYHGAVDSEWEESADRQNYLRDALNRLLDGGDPDPDETPAVGCVIRYREATQGT